VLKAVAELDREMLISHDTNETRVAFLENRELVELYIERPKRSVVGNVYLGRVTDVLPGMQAAFVDIGHEKNAFLYVDEVVAPEGVENMPRREIQSLLRVGQQVMVQVVKDAMGTKGARVTTDISLPGRFLVLMPFSDFVGVSKKLAEEERDRLHSIVARHAPTGTGVIVRTAALGASERDLSTDLEFLLRLWKRVNHQATEALAPEVIYTEMDLALRLVRDVYSDEFHRLVVDDRATFEKVTSFLKKTSPQLVRSVQLHKDTVPLFDKYRLQETIDSALRRTVALPSGGHLTVDKTEALTAIDVNTGRFVGKKSLEETVLRTNLEAADEVVRQLRLRDIGGIIIVDFIDMEVAASKAALSERIDKAFERDRTKTRVSEISRLGLVEITRKNVTDGLYGVLTEACPTCGGEGRVVSRMTRRIAVERRMREILRNGRSNAYLFGLNPATYELVMAPGLNVAASLRAETGKQVSIVADDEADATEVRVLIEGKTGLLRRAFE
jgi:ribonuclease G